MAELLLPIKAMNRFLITSYISKVARYPTKHPAEIKGIAGYIFPFFVKAKRQSRASVDPAIIINAGINPPIL